MPSPVPELSNAGKPRQGSVAFSKVLQSRWTFVALQTLDLLTTMAAFHVGAFEVNPMVAHLITYLGRWRGVLASKLIAIAIAMGVRKRLWIVNVFYGAIILWNIIMIVALTTKR